MSIALNYNSQTYKLDLLSQLCLQNSTCKTVEGLFQNGIMIYGFDHCKYEPISYGLRLQKVKVYDSDLGDELMMSESVTRSDGTKIPKIPSGCHEKKIGAFKTLSRKCKTALVNMVFENIKLMHEKKDLIPIIFCIDIIDNRYQLSSVNLLSKTKEGKDPENYAFQMNSLITHKELRRAYKLCYDPEVSRLFQEVAKKSFHFVKVVSSVQFEQNVILTALNQLLTPNQVQLEQTPAPWERSDWNFHWIERMYQTNPNPPSKSCEWRKIVNAAAKNSPPHGFSL